MWKEGLVGRRGWRKRTPWQAWAGSGHSIPFIVHSHIQLTAQLTSQTCLLLLAFLLNYFLFHAHFLLLHLCLCSLCFVLSVSISHKHSFICMSLLTCSCSFFLYIYEKVEETGRWRSGVHFSREQGRGVELTAPHPTRQGKNNTVLFLLTSLLPSLSGSFPGFSH